MTTELDKYKRMFQAACEELGTDPNDGGAMPILEAIQALKTERDESDGVRDILAKHLAGVAIALKGPELELRGHSYHDLAEKAHVAMLEIELLKHVNAELKKQAEKSERRAVIFGQIIENYTLAMQAAVIDAELDSQIAGMNWIFNTLCGPGNLPDMDEAKAIGGAQAWFDAKTAEESARVALNGEAAA